MATVAVIVGAAIVNAVAFTIGNALYDKFGRTDGSVERDRHDKAVEDLQKANVDWNKKRLETLDFINNETRQKNDARNRFDDVDRALEFYIHTHPDGEIILPPRPKLEDFYSLSPEQNYYEAVIAAMIGGIVGYIAFRYM